MGVFCSHLQCVVLSCASSRQGSAAGTTPIKEAVITLVSLNYANVETPSPGSAWRESSDETRQTLVANALRVLNRSEVVPVTAKENGQVFVTLAEPLPAAKRGPLLLDIEQALKQTIDPALVVWLQPMGDRNSLRNLRGIEVKQ